MNDTEETRRRAKLEVDAFLAEISERYGMKPLDAIETIKYVQEQRKAREHLSKIAIVAIITSVVGGGLLLLWEGLKVLLRASVGPANASILERIDPSPMMTLDPERLATWLVTMLASAAFFSMAVRIASIGWHSKIWRWLFAIGWSSVCWRFWAFLVWNFGGPPVVHPLSVIGVGSLAVGTVLMVIDAERNAGHRLHFIQDVIDAWNLWRSHR